MSASIDMRGRLLFRTGWTMARLNELLEAGGTILRHRLEATESPQDVLARCGGEDRLLFVVAQEGSIRPVAENLSPRPEPGDWLIIACDPSSPTAGKGENGPNRS